jgi:hypothetical protein
MLKILIHLSSITILIETLQQSIALFCQQTQQKKQQQKTIS